MDFYPKQPDLEKPPIAAGLTLVVGQIAAGAAMVLIGSLLRGPGGSGLSMVGAFVGAMSYASWCESAVPGSLSRRPLVLRLSFIASLAQVALALVYLALVSVAAKSEPGVALPPLGAMLIAVPIAAVVCFFVTWLGLSQGRRVMEKQRRRSQPKP